MSGERLSDDILVEVERTIKREKEQKHDLMVCIGTDSTERKNYIEFATVIVFLRKRRGGFMFIQNSRSRKDIGLKERMLMEVSKSIEISYQLCPLLDKYGVELEVHADINTDPHFKSNRALSEAMGYIIGMGYTFKAKPDAFASSSCADRFVN